MPAKVLEKYFHGVRRAAQLRIERGIAAEHQLADGDNDLVDQEFEPDIMCVATPMGQMLREALKSLSHIAVGPPDGFMVLTEERFQAIAFG